MNKQRLYAVTGAAIKALIALVIVVRVVTIYPLPFSFDLSGSDWHSFFQPHASRLSGLYDNGPQHYPPWTFVFLAPLAVLPQDAGYLCLAIVSIVVATLVVKRRWRAVLLLTSAPVVMAMAFGNIDVLLSAAFLLPFPLALIVVACKPQAMWAWAVRSWISKPTIIGLVPLAATVALSLVAYGWWPGRLDGELLATNLLISHLWPWTMVPGLLLLLATDDPLLWMVGGIMVTPYLQVYHIAPVFVYAYSRCKPTQLVCMTIMSWIVVVLMFG